MLDLALEVGASFLRGLFRPDSESEPVLSSEDLPPRDVYVQVLRFLYKQEEESFCTFECPDYVGIWFQVFGTNLGVGYCTWRLGTGTPEEDLARERIACPAGFQSYEEDFYDGRRVITFECDPMTPAEWAEFIDAVMRRMHRLPGDYRVKGYITQA